MIIEIYQKNNGAWLLRRKRWGEWKKMVESKDKSDILHAIECKMIDIQRF